MYRSAMRRIAHALVLSFIATAVIVSDAALVPTQAHAERYQMAKQLPECRGVAAMQLKVKGASTKFTLPVNSQIWTTIKVPNGIQKMSNPPDSNFVIRRGISTIDVAPIANAPAGAKTSMRFDSVSAETGEQYTATIVVEVVKSADVPPDLAVVVHESEADAQEARINAIAEDEAAKRARRIVREKYLKGYEEIVFGGERPVIVEKGAILIEVIRAFRLGTDILIQFAVTNRDEASWKLESLAAFYEDRQRDLSGGATFQLDEFPPEGLIAEIPGRERVLGVITIPDAKDITNIEEIDLSFKAAESAGPIMVAVSVWRPVGKAELEREARAKQVIVSLRASGGALWLGNDIGQTVGKLDATRATGLGVRVTKGFNENWAAVAEIAGSQSGDARFDGVMFDGQEGELTRKASIGRVLLGGMLRFGDQTIPYARLAIGVQGASYDSQFKVGDAMMPGPESSFEVAGLWSIGAGVEKRLGQNWIAGLGFSYYERFDNTERLLELGATFSYGWTP